MTLISEKTEVTYASHFGQSTHMKLSHVHYMACYKYDTVSCMLYGTLYTQNCLIYTVWYITHAKLSHVDYMVHYFQPEKVQILCTVAKTLFTHLFLC